VAPLPPNQAPAQGEVEKTCPYIRSNFTDGPPDVADDEGDRVYRTTVITTMHPIGCRFYFWAAPYEATADIVTKKYATAADAHNAMVATGNAGHSAEAVKNLVPGVDAVLFQTRFFGPNGASDWACAFATDSLLVIVHTQQTNDSLAPRNIAVDIYPKI
jgi:hypothetical protein